jgi:hypothetical protein
VQTERLGHPLAHQLVERRSTGALGQHAEADEADVAVHVPLPRLGGRRRGEGCGEPLLGRRVRAPQRQPGGQAGGVRQQVPRRDVLLAVRGELRHHVGDRGVEVDRALLHQVEHDHRGEQLGDRGQVVDGVRRGRHLLVRRQLGAGQVGVPHRVPGRLLGHDDAVVHDQGDRARLLRTAGTGAVGVLRGGGDGGQPLLQRPGIEADLLGRAVAQHRRRRREALLRTVEPALHPRPSLRLAGGRCGRAGQAGGQRERSRRGDERADATR